MEMRVGEKIKQTRKELKMTQADLGGSHISKGMLSLIENNLASPSMKSLQFIAEKLNKPISYFVDNNVPENIPDDSIEINLLLSKTNALISQAKYKAPSNLLAEMDDIIQQFTKPYKIVHANIFYQFGLTLTNTFQFEESDVYFKTALDIYNINNLVLDTSKVYFNMHFNYYFQYDFIKCKETLDLAIDCYYNSINKDFIHEINLLYHKADLLCLTHSDFNQAARTIDQAIELSLETSMYLLERLYRLKALLYVDHQNYNEFKINIDKSLLLCKASSQFNKILVLNAIAFGENSLGDCSIAYSCLEEAKFLFIDLFKIQGNQIDDYTFINEISQKLSSQSNNLDSEQHSKALYSWLFERANTFYSLGHKEQALEILNQIDFDFFASRFVLIPDRVFFWRERIKQSLILSKCGKSDDAIKIAFMVRDHLLDVQSFYDLYRLFECLSEIYNELGKFENAYQALQSAHKYLKENVSYSF